MLQEVAKKKRRDSNNYFFADVSQSTLFVRVARNESLGTEQSDGGFAAATTGDKSSKEIGRARRPCAWARETSVFTRGRADSG